MSELLRPRPGGASRLRYERIRALGRGGSGHVWEAHDRERGHRVALKTLRHATAEGIFRLKREFRQLAEVGHPNIVRLYDLVFEGGEWFYTMEVVRGVDFVRFCVGGEAATSRPGPDVERVRRGLHGLAQGLVALHASGKVHRDVKPSNVLVTPAGRVVLLDFGLVSDISAHDDTVSGEHAGTARYMAPEQMALIDAKDPAGDWYAVGVMLFEVLAGIPPFSGSPAEIARAKRIQEPPSLPACESIPGDLRRLCAALLSRDPARRAGGDAVLSVVAGVLAASAPGLGPASAHADAAPFVGRERELGVLAAGARAAASGRAATVLVRGDSGIGKTGLVQQFLALERRGSAAVTILAGGCRARERIPYRSIDGLIDQLCEHWRGLPATDAAFLLPRDAGLLREAFPILERVPAVATAPRRATSDAQDRRLAGLGALREVLHRLATRATTILFLDDLQWVDADTLALLRYLLQPPDAPPVLWILASRSHGSAFGELEALFDLTPPASAHTLDLEPLARVDATRFAESLLGAGAEAVAAELAREAAGNPCLVELLARNAGRRAETTRVLNLKAALEQELAEFGEAERNLIEVVCLAGEPLPPLIVVRAARLNEEAAAGPVAVLRQRKLIRTAAGVRGDAVEPYHDRIRELVLLGLSAPARRARFEALAFALQGWEGASDELLARCWVGADDASRASFHARRAADRASRALAFEHAADLYAQCIELSVGTENERLDLLIRAGEALSNAGRGAQAAARYLEVAERTSGSQSLDFRLRASNELLQCGHVDEGISVLAPVLDVHGLRLPRSTFDVVRVVLVATLLRRIRHPRFRHRARAEAELPAEQLRLIDLNWSAMTGLMDVAPDAAVAFQVRHLGLSLEAGEPKRLARSLAAAGLRIAAFTHRVASARPYVELAEGIVAERGDEVLGAQVAVFTKACSFIAGAPGIGLEELIVAERRLKEQGLEFRAEAKHVALIINVSLSLTGQIRRLGERVEPGLRDARQRGDLMLMSCFGTGFASTSWLASDQVEAADELALDIMGRWARSRYFMQHFFCLVARVQAALYRGDARAAADLVAAHDEPHRRSKLVKMGINAALFLDLVARAASALRLEGNAAGHPIVGCESRMRRKVGRLASPLARATVLAMDAERAVTSRSDSAPRALTRAVDAYERGGMAMHAAASRYARGKLIQGDNGMEDMRRALDFFVSEGVVAPEKFIAMLLPCVRALV